MISRDLREARTTAAQLAPFQSPHTERVLPFCLASDTDWVKAG
jgi:hypothetical protein